MSSLQKRGMDFSILFTLTAEKNMAVKETIQRKNYVIGKSRKNRKVAKVIAISSVIKVWFTAW